MKLGTVLPLGMRHKAMHPAIFRMKEAHAVTFLEIAVLWIDLHTAT